MIEIDVRIDPRIWRAIEQKRLIRIWHKNRERIVEPHDYGIHRGVVKLFAFQVGGSSSQRLPNWRWMEQDLMKDIEILDRTFRGGRPSRSGKHHKWDRIFIRGRAGG